MIQSLDRKKQRKLSEWWTEGVIFMKGIEWKNTHYPLEIPEKWRRPKVNRYGHLKVSIKFTLQKPWKRASGLPKKSKLSLLHVTFQRLRWVGASANKKIRRNTKFGKWTYFSLFSSRSFLTAYVCALESFIPKSQCSKTNRDSFWKV